MEIEPVRYVNPASLRVGDNNEGLCCCEGCPNAVECTGNSCDNYFTFCLTRENGIKACRMLDATSQGDSIDFDTYMINDCNVRLPFISSEPEVRIKLEILELCITVDKEMKTYYIALQLQLKRYIVCFHGKDLTKSYCIHYIR